jgi:hypothetical protein
MKKKYQIFVSSTYTDLQLERQAAVESILLAHHIPAGMELFSAGSETQLEVIKRWIEESDVYMLILGGRYGAIEPSSQMSYTEIEYDHAVHLGKPLFAVVLTESAIEEKVKSGGSDFLEKYEPKKYESFRKKVLSRISKIVSDEKDIKLAVLQYLLSLEHTQKIDGWIRASSVQVKSNDGSLPILNTQVANTPKFELIDSFPKNNEPISIEDIKKIYVKFSNPVDRNTVMYIASHQFRQNVRQQWNVNGWIQFEDNDTKLIWHINKQLLAEEPPYSPEDLEYHRFEIMIGTGHPDASLKDIYGNSLGLVIIPVHIKP